MNGWMVFTALDGSLLDATYAPATSTWTKESDVYARG